MAWSNGMKILFSHLFNTKPFLAFNILEEKGDFSFHLSLQLSSFSIYIYFPGYLLFMQYANISAQSISVDWKTDVLFLLMLCRKIFISAENYSSVCCLGVHTSSALLNYFSSYIWVLSLSHVFFPFGKLSVTKMIKFVPSLFLSLKTIPFYSDNDILLF